jgi:hypothetical protein
VRDSHFSLTDLLAINGPIPEGFLFVVVKSYFDGGNQANSRQYDVLSLAVMSGTKDEWTPFENDWNAVLLKHHAAYLYTTDAMSSRKTIYSREKREKRKRGNARGKRKGTKLCLSKFPYGCYLFSRSCYWSLET